MSGLEIHNLAKFYSSDSSNKPNFSALSQFSLTVEPGSFAMVLGPSGCGKSTLLKLIAGLEQPDAGTILLDGAPIQQAPRDRHTLVPSTLTMLPWLDVRGNIELGLRANHASRDELHERTEHVIQQTNLNGYEKHFVRDLPPVLQQLTVIARALALNPDILLMDEPFSQLDAQNRLLMQKEVLRLWEAEPRTVLFTTHDIDEAILLGSTIHLMTPRPGAVRCSIPIDLPRPRSHESVVHPGFIRIKKQIMDILLA